MHSYSKDQWVQYLKEWAYPGAKINRVAKRLEGNRFPDLIKDANEIKLTYDGDKTVTIKLDKLLKKHDSWTLSRLIHNIKMAVSSDYAEDFNDTYSTIWFLTSILSSALPARKKPPISNRALFSGAGSAW